MRKQQRARILDQHATEAISDETDLWPTIHAQISSMAVGRWRRSATGFAIAAALILVIGVTSPLWSHPDAASAQAILDRAAASDTPGVVTTYHLLLTRQASPEGGATVIAEMWYGGKDRQRRDQRTTDGHGVTISSDSVVFNGSHVWLISTKDGQTQVVHTTGTTWNDAVDDPTRRTSLTDVLNQYGSDKMCLTAAQSGEAMVANRASYVIVLRPDLARCALSGMGDAASKALHGAPIKLGQLGSADNSIGQMTVWVDKQSFLPLKTEVRNLAGTFLDRSEVTNVEYNVPIPEATFSYLPPAGATVRNFSGGSGADVKRAIFGGSASTATPTVVGKP